MEVIAGAGSEGRDTIRLRGRQVVLLVRPLWRATRVAPILAAALAGLVIVHLGRPVGWAGTAVANLPEAGTLLCFGAAFVLDDPAANVLAASPTTLIFRRCLRAALVIPLLALLWGVLLWHAQIPAGAWSLTAAFSGMLVVTLAIAAVAGHLVPGGLGGMAVGPTLFVLMLAQLLMPEGWRFLPLNFGRHWVDAGPRALMTTAAALAVFLAASLDPARRGWLRAIRDGMRARPITAGEQIRAGPIERALLLARVPEHAARLIAVTPSLRTSWLGAEAVALGFSVLAHRFGPGGPILFLVVAPLLPLAGVALAFGPHADPTYEVGQAAPMSGMHVLLVRTVAVLSVTFGVAGVAALFLPDLDWTAMAWILPALGLTLASLALSTFVPAAWAAGAVVMVWLAAIVITESMSKTRLTAFRGPGQVVFFVLVVASSGVLAWRRERLERDGRAERQRLIDAAEAERRRVERNIHDGAQQQLVAIRVKLGLARAMVTRDPAKAEAILAELQAETQDALDNLRDMTRGTYPPVLADDGLAAALEAKAHRLPFAVAVDADGVGRLPREIETAVYFCCLEALQNASKHAKPSWATVSVRHVGGELAFSVSDDGAGFNPETARKGVGVRSMAERVETLGGSFEMRSAPGAGTVIVARIPEAAWRGC